MQKEETVQSKGSAIAVLAVIFLSMIPLCCELPYLLTVWAGASVNHYDVFFWLYGITLGIILVRSHKKRIMFEHSLIPILSSVMCLFVFFGGMYVRIHLLAIFGGIGVLFSMMYAVYGWELGTKLLPLSLLFVIGLPTTSLCVLVPIAGVLQKVVVCVGVTLWIVLSWKWRPAYPSQKMPVILFMLMFFAAGGSAAIPLLPGVEEQYGDSFRPDFRRSSIGKYVGESLPLSSMDKAFFKGCSEVSRLRFYSSDSEVGVLQLETFDSVHNIHDPAVCLHAGRWTIAGKRTEALEVCGRRVIGQLLVVSKAEYKSLVYSWLDNGLFSTGDFWSYRTAKEKKGWRIYQVVFPFEGDQEVALVKMRSFMNNSASGIAGNSTKSEKGESN